MKTHIRFCIAGCLSVVLLNVTYAGPQVNAKLRTRVYLWQNGSDDENHTRWYQSLALNANRLGHQNVSFHTYLRTAHDFQSDAGLNTPTRIYNAYLDWKRIGNVLDMRLGRQFVHFGVGSATMDGLRLTLAQQRRFRLSLYYGAETPFSRPGTELSGLSEKQIMGAYLSSTAILKTRLGLSYVRKSRDNETRWEQAGLMLDRSFGSMWMVLAKINYNLDTQDIHEMLVRIRFTQSNDLTMSTDFGRRKPRFDVDSYFNIFEIEPYDWFRLSVSKHLGSWLKLNAMVRMTMLEDKQATRVQVSGDMGLFQVGLMNQSGYGGNNLGLFGGVQKEITDKMMLAARLNFSRFTLEEIVGDVENAMFSYLMFGYRIHKDFKTQVSLQHLTNPQYERDLRAIVNIAYTFRQR